MKARDHDSKASWKPHRKTLIEWLATKLVHGETHTDEKRSTTRGRRQ